MKELLKKKLTREEFLKAGLGLLAGVLITSSLTKIKKNNKTGSYGNSVYGGGRQW